MIIEDHINFMGHNPLIGKNQLSPAPRFPDKLKSTVTAPRTRKKDRRRENDNPQNRDLPLSGPAFEAPAEIRAYQIGASAVGITVPEAISPMP